MGSKKVVEADLDDDVFVEFDSKNSTSLSSGNAPSDVLIIETGDMVKLKQTFDDCLGFVFEEEGIKQDFTCENFKLIIMFIACVIGCIAQFYPAKFPDNSLLLAVCSVCYFGICGVFQYFVFLQEVDIICRLRENNHLVIVRSSFPRYQEYYTLKIHINEESNTNSGWFGLNPNVNEVKCVTGVFYVGDYFTERGEFYEAGFRRNVLKLLHEFQAEHYGEIDFSSRPQKK